MQQARTVWRNGGSSPADNFIKQKNTIIDTYFSAYLEKNFTEIQNKSVILHFDLI